MSRRFAPTTTAAIAAATAALASGPALAHHVMDGALPATFAQGLLSGLGHPVIGPDHLAAVLAAGLLAAAAGATPLVPLAFALASLVGVGLHLALFELPLGETLVALSVVALGLALLARRLPRRPRQAPSSPSRSPRRASSTATPTARSIVGAEPAPLYAYLLGLVLVQGALATAAFLVAKLAAKAARCRRGGSTVWRQSPCCWSGSARSPSPEARRGGAAGRAVPDVEVRAPEARDLPAVAALIAAGFEAYVAAGCAEEGRDGFGPTSRPWRSRGAWREGPWPGSPSRAGWPAVSWSATASCATATTGGRPAGSTTWPCCSPPPTDCAAGSVGCSWTCWSMPRWSFAPAASTS
jgi:urease accessory protein